VHQNPNSIRFVDRTAYIGRFVPRNSGVVRRSPKVLLMNEKFARVMGEKGDGCAKKGVGEGWHEHLKAVRACIREKHPNGLGLTDEELKAAGIPVEEKTGAKKSAK
jgi:hypothetical protein